MITVRRVQECAESLGFRPDAMEKVLRLCGILGRLSSNELAEGAWVLKGGTALNLFHLDLPRLSVDIALNLVGVEDVDVLALARERFEKVLSACCEREGCAVRRAPTEHAGGKFRLRFASVLGGSQNLEVDVSYVLRVPLLGTERRSLPSALARDRIEVPLLTLDELAAGKVVALMARGASRDWFDVAMLLERFPGLLERIGFRVAVTCLAAGSRMDLRAARLDLGLLHDADVRQQLVPVLRVVDEGTSEDPDALAARLRSHLAPVLERLATWLPEETEFLGALSDHGQILPELLTDDPALRDRIMRQPMLRWKQRRVLKHLDGRTGN